ncbi:MAG: outer membrane protein assembly factor BamA [Treponema sp.]|jgi:outer membrane protein insertion porin family|nr:outer membrane protein assembly factor BamA [Treponema sp.]
MRRVFVFFLILAAASSVFAQESGDWYQGKPIRNIVFEGLNHVDASELEGIVGPFINRNFTDDLYYELLGRLYALEFFETINPTAMRADSYGNDVIIRFQVTERPIISRIVFSGNSGLRTRDIQDVISLKLQDVATQIKLRMDEIAIINKYLEKGYPDVKVRTEVQNGPNSTLIVTFHIEEGEKITIEEFRFEGNSIFSARTLQRQLSLKTKGAFNDGAFQESLLIADREALAAYYHERGYIDAMVIDESREIRRDARGNNNMIITFRIYEGRLYTFGGITFEGNQIFPTEQLSALVYSRVGEIANVRRIQADLIRVTDIYYENGYIFNYIEPQVIQNPETGVLSFHIIIIERGRAHIENIIIRGNVKTKDLVILQEIPLESGDIFSKAKLMDGYRNLMNLMYFSSVIAEPVPGSADNLVDLIFTVEEQSTMDLQLGLAFSGSADPDTFPVSLQVSWNDSNFLGSGNVVGASINVSPDTQMLSLNYTQRRLFKEVPLSGSVMLSLQHTKSNAPMNWLSPWFNGNEDYAYPDGFGSREEYDKASKVVPSEFQMPYNDWSISLEASTGYRWSTFLGNLSVGGGLGIGLLYKAYDASLYRPFDPVLRRENNRWTPATSIWASVSLDQRDINYDPSNGYFASQRISYDGVLGFEDEHYIRTDTKLEWFTTLWDLRVSDNWSFKGVLGIHTGLSFIFPQPGRNLSITETKKLALDGMFVGRGWYNEYYNTGYALWENWVELRIPLAPGILAWDFFFDAAGVKKNPSDLFTNFATRDINGDFFMRFSFGGGIRFTIPQFPLRLSIAKLFKISSRGVEWQRGPLAGFDIVISFAIF